MKLKKKVKVTLFLIIVILLAVGGLYLYNKSTPKKKEVKEVKIVSEVSKFDYKLKENKSTTYKDMFKELKEILKNEEVDEEAYVKKISEMFIYDFYSLSDKTAKTDIGGIDFVYQPILENFLMNAEDTYYKYLESNIYNERKQTLPVVTNINIESVTQAAFAYGNQTDDKAYVVKASWSYTEDKFSGYQKTATMVFIHDGIKLSLVELQK